MFEMGRGVDRIIYFFCRIGNRIFCFIWNYIEFKDRGKECNLLIKIEVCLKRNSLGIVVLLGIYVGEWFCV